MTTPDLTLRLATVDDAAELAAFAERTYRDTFSAHNRPEDIDAYCSKVHGREHQRRELAAPNRITLLAEVGKELAGFAQLRSGPAPDCVTQPEPIELLRFYVDRPWHGRGVAPRLMTATIAAAERLGARTLYLGAWESNFRALAFYAKQGFQDVGSRLFIVGDDHQTDRIMLRSIGERSSASRGDGSTGQLTDANGGRRL